MKDMSYDSAYARLEEMVKKLESSDTSLDQVEGCLKEAVSLIEYCKKELKGYKENFESLLD
ncbi:MAG: exodeoxyribonuclease VII small subunit [Bacteroidales bacterium]|nr:exodeoxyribonuclease VII small subunit [Bacteroidales bacterium]